jgi:hypothetical protein
MFAVVHKNLSNAYDGPSISGQRQNGETWRGKNTRT